MWDRLLEIMEKTPGHGIAVIGDFMLDAYLYGDAERISPEAPVPVLRVVNETFALGGAGSVAADIAALGDTPYCFGLIGDDAAGKTVREQLQAVGADTGGLLVTDDRPTTRKTRLVGLAQHRHRQQLIRIDAEQTDPLDAALVERLIERLRAVLDQCRVVCIEDYGKGVVTADLTDRVIALADERKVAVLVDPMRRGDYSLYRGATLVTPNRSETELLVGERLLTIEAVRAAADRILRACGTQSVCVTLDAEGAALITAGGLANGGGEPRRSYAAVEHVPTRPRDVYDVTGAGDAVLAALAVAVARGATLPEAVALANVAGGLEVEKFGCVPVTRDEMLAELIALNHEHLGKRRRLEQLLPELARRRARGQRVAFTNGCFDLLHPGHVEYLAFCRRQSDLLVVGLNSDDSVRSQRKGDDRPLLPQDDRARMLAALADVDYVVVFDEPTPERLIEAVRPDVLVKGEDWADRGVVGQQFVESYGGRVVLAPLVPGYSTSDLLARIRAATDGP
jgi:D-beta-D-heptose 7-phosphate kinase/D-beta-D-heptose 1-phosphate adenosyltransferase